MVNSEGPQPHAVAAQSILCNQVSLQAVHIPGKLNTGADASPVDALFSPLPGAIGTNPTNSSSSSSSRPPHAQPARLDLSQLAPAVRGVFSSGLAESTRKT